MPFPFLFKETIDCSGLSGDSNALQAEQDLGHGCHGFSRIFAVNRQQSAPRSALGQSAAALIAEG